MLVLVSIPRLVWRVLGRPLRLRGFAGQAPLRRSDTEHGVNTQERRELLSLRGKLGLTNPVAREMA